MSDRPATGLSRRDFLRINTTVLAGVAIATAFPVAANALDRRVPTAVGAVDLAGGRPVSVSSTDLGPVAPELAVDGMRDVGVKGSGWRAEPGADQWIAVDLQGLCTVTGLRVTFEAKQGDPAFVPPGDESNPRSGTTGWEILSSYASAFRIETSTDGKTWTSAYSTSSSTGGAVDITLDAPAKARHVRLVSTALSTTNPLGVNGFEVLGTADEERPEAIAWTDGWGADAAPAPALEVADDGTVALESGWRLTMDSRAGTDDGAELAQPGVDTAGWLQATVPGTVLATLVERGHLPDPVFGLDNLHVPEALSRHSWWYRREFEIPAGLDSGSGRRVWLEVDGINHEAQLWLNGTKLDTMAHPFDRRQLDVTAALNAGGTQVLAVKISPMPNPGSPGDKGPSGSSYTDAGSNMVNQASPTWLSVTGWDWMPAVRDRASGIWNHLRLRSTGDVRADDLRVDTVLPDLPDTSVAEVTVTVPVRNAAATARDAKVEISFSGITASQTVTVAGGGRADAVFAAADFDQLRVQDPDLWWPNGYGDPALHQLGVTVTVDGATSDERDRTFGLRQVDYDYELPFSVENGKDRVDQTVDLDAPQTARYLRIVGDKRATGYGISLWTLAVHDSTDPGTDLALNKTATASSTDGNGDAPRAVDGDAKTRWSSNYTDGQWIQVDLGAGTTFDQVVLTWESALASLFRVQVSDDAKTWTDVETVDNGATQLQMSVNGVRIMCRGGNWGWDELLRRGIDGRIQAQVALHKDMNFNMIRVWLATSNREEFYDACDRNGIMVWQDFPLAWTLNPPDHAVFVAQGRDTVLRYRSHPCITIWCGANEGTPPAEVDNGLRKAVTELTPLLYQSNSREGIVTGGGPYWLMDPAQYFTDNPFLKHGFSSEIGAPTVSVAESMRNLVGTGQEWPPADSWWLHDWASKGAQGVDSYRAAIEKKLGTASGLDDFCEKAQFVNYETFRAMFEAWNATLWNPSSGILLWMSNPAWHSTTWQMYDYDLDVNGSYHGARKGCEPLHVQADHTDWTVRAVNHTTQPLTGVTITAELFTIDGTPIGAPRTETVDVEASNQTATTPVAFGASLPAVHLLRLRLTSADGDLLSENTYWRYRTDTDVQAISDLPTTTVAATPTWNRQEGTGSVALKNTGTTTAVMVRVSLRHRDTGERALPATASENYFWMLPGEERTVDLAYAGWTERGGEMDVVVEGYNVESDASPLGLTVDVTPRTMGSSVYVAVRATNGGDAPVDVVIETPYGRRSFLAVAPGKNAYQSFPSRQTSVPTGVVTVTATRTDGRRQREEVAFDAFPA